MEFVTILIAFTLKSLRNSAIFMLYSRVVQQYEKKPLGKERFVLF
jgi:hypothetical protein